MKIKSTFITIPQKHKKLLLSAGKFAESRKIKIWAVGGCVRDWYLGTETKDIDLITETKTAEIADFISKKLKTKKEFFGQFGTYRFKLKNGFNLDLAQTRKEIYPEPAALPKVAPADIKKDLYRRDFTVNTLAISIMPVNFGKIYDPFGALSDIDKGIIKVLHKKSFTDDPTRIFRAFRFSGRFGWKLESKTLKLAKSAIKKGLPGLLSRFRISRELICILSEKKSEPIFKLLSKYKLLEFFHPKLKWNKKAFILKNPYERLGVLACLAGKAGVYFLKSLNLKREIFNELKTAAELNLAETASLKPLTETQKNILKAANPALPASALKPLILKGRDLQKLGIKPQKKYSSILKKLARLQWQGKLQTKKQAIKLLALCR